jgi:hypothetical protein
VTPARRRGEPPAPDEAPPGAGTIRLAWGLTALFVVVALGAAVDPDRLAPAAVVVDLALFAVGCGAFVVSFVRAAARSREELVSLAGVYGLAGAPAPVRRALFGALGVQVVVALATAAVRPFTALAFGILVPTLGIGLAGVWGARHGRFPPRPPRPTRRRPAPPRGAPTAPAADAAPAAEPPPAGGRPTPPG